MAEERPLGGNLNDAVRVGNTVRRRAGPWTPAVHALLRFLEAEGFPAPRARGMDEKGREVLDYIEGEAHAGNPIPLPDSVFDEGHMIEAARLLRRYHDIVARFRPSPELVWRLVSPGPHELILHNDWSPWNALFRDGRFALTLDWDLAGPGPRIWDVANAAYCWVPLIAGASAIPDNRERAAKLRIAHDLGIVRRHGHVAISRHLFRDRPKLLRGDAMLRQKRRVRVAFPSRRRIALVERGQVLCVVVADGVDDLGELCG